jgi:hypothetical protein
MNNEISNNIPKLRGSFLLSFQPILKFILYIKLNKFYRATFMGLGGAAFRLSLCLSFCLYVFFPLPLFLFFFSLSFSFSLSLSFSLFSSFSLAICLSFVLLSVCFSVYLSFSHSLSFSSLRLSIITL